MLKEDREWVLEVIKLETAKLTPQPVEVDIDKIVDAVLDKIAAKSAEKVPVKGKKE